MTKHRGGHPKGMPKSQIKNIITRVKAMLPQAYETIRKAVSYPREKEDLTKRYKKALKDFRETGTHKFDVSEERAELDSLYNRGKIEEKDFLARNQEEELIKSAYQNELSNLKPDDTSLATAKWAVEKVVDMYIKAGTDVKNRLAQNEALAKINKELGLGDGKGAEIVEDEDDEEEITGRLSLAYIQKE